jgi:hypothetical protein
LSAGRGGWAARLRAVLWSACGCFSLGAQDYVDSVGDVWDATAFDLNRVNREMIEVFATKQFRTYSSTVIAARPARPESP